MSYNASEELVQIFLKNGFSDVTVKDYPDHVKRIKRDGYHPHQQKRKFVFGNRSKHSVLFDYISITPYHYGGCRAGDQKLELTEEELKSIITFYKLPTQTQLAYGRTGGRITELYLRYKKISENPDLYKRKSDNTIKMHFESVVL